MGRRSGQVPGPFIEPSSVSTKNGRHRCGPGLHATADQGVMPLHYAAEEHASAKVVAALLTVHPEGAGVKDRRGRLPLHLAISHWRQHTAVVSPASAEVVKLLLDAHPEGAKVKDSDGELPLQKAIMGRASAEVVKLLREAHPEGE